VPDLKMLEAPEREMWPSRARDGTLNEGETFPFLEDGLKKTNRRMVTYEFGPSRMDQKARVCANIKIVAPCHLKRERRFLGYTPGSGRYRREKRAMKNMISHVIDRCP
jgi:hypothetical protein